VHLHTLFDQELGLGFHEQGLQDAALKTLIVRSMGIRHLCHEKRVSKVGWAKSTH